jgi:hypothetical protein
MYPDLVDAGRRREMDALARNEKKQLRGANLLSHEARKHVSQLGGVAVSSQEKKK